jgi:hypothetical protein
VKNLTLKQFASLGGNRKRLRARPYGDVVAAVRVRIGECDAAAGDEVDVLGEPFFPSSDVELDAAGNTARYGSALFYNVGQVLNGGSVYLAALSVEAPRYPCR